MTLFRYEELELLICGLPHLDFHELERVTLVSYLTFANHISLFCSMMVGTLQPLESFKISGVFYMS